MKRREFTRRQRAQIILRATNADGVVCCEGCGLVLGHKPFQIDHTLAEALVMDKTKPLAIEEGKLLGQACCHVVKSGDDIRMVRKADRQRDYDTGASKKPPQIKSAGFRPAAPQRRASTPSSKTMPRRFQ